MLRRELLLPVPREYNIPSTRPLSRLYPELSYSSSSSQLTSWTWKFIGTIPSVLFLHCSFFFAFAAQQQQQRKLGNDFLDAFTFYLLKRFSFDLSKKE